VNQIMLVTVIIGVMLLILGRKLFWFFVGVAGFLIGMNIAGQVTSGTESTKLLIGLVAGVIGALLAILLQKVAIAVAGFVIGGYITVELLRLYGAALPVYTRLHGNAYWVPYVIGGIIGAILMVLLFDWALIVLSSLAGASMILHGIAVQPRALPLLYVVLAILGIVIQAHLMRSRALAP